MSRDKKGSFMKPACMLTMLFVVVAILLLILTVWRLVLDVLQTINPRDPKGHLQ